MKERLNICFFVDFMIFPPADGGQKAKYYRILDIAKHHNVSIITSDLNINNDKQSEEYSFANLKKRLINLKFFERPVKEFKKAGFLKKIEIYFRWLLSGKTYNEFIYSSSLNSNDIKKFLIETKPDLLISETIYFTDLIDTKFLAKNNINSMLVLHNVESKFFKETTIEKNIFVNPFIQQETNRIIKLEEVVLKKVDMTVGISDYDVNYYKDKFKLGNIIYKPVLLPTAETAWSINTDSDYIVFTGGLSFYANYQGLSYFLENIFSSFIKKYPNVILKITGESSSGIKNKFKKYRNIEFTGFLSEIELDKLLAKSLFGIVPIMVGSGIKVKLLELLSMGIPTIATSKSAIGIQTSKNDPAFLVANDEIEFLDYMIKLMEDNQLKQELSAKAMQFFAQDYEIGKNIDKWLEIITQTVRISDQAE